MSHHVGHGPFQAVFNRGTLFADDVGHIAHGRRFKVEIKGAGNRTQSRKFGAPKCCHQRRIDDAHGLDGKGAKASIVNAHSFSGGIQYASRYGLVFGSED